MQKDLKLKIISEGLKNGVSTTCRKYDISRTLYYRWLKRYQTFGLDGLDTLKKDFIPPNKTALQLEQAVLNLIREYPHYGPRAIKYLLDEVGHTLSESAVYNIMKRNNLSQKADRVKFAKKPDTNILPSLPPLSELASGECWLFWIADLGQYGTLGNLYEYTLYDLKSRIACTRLYTQKSFSHFEELLSAVAMPVATTLGLKLNYLCFFEENKFPKLSYKHFNNKMKESLLANGFDFKIHILNHSHENFDIIDTLRKDYTQGCISFLLPFLNEASTLKDLKIKLQDYVRHYNMYAKSIVEDSAYSPIEYHNKLTNTKLILPIWAYMDRNY